MLIVLIAPCVFRRRSVVGLRFLACLRWLLNYLVYLFAPPFFNVTYCQVQGFFAMALLFAAIGFAFRPLHRHAGLLMTLYRLVRLITLYRLGYHYDETTNRVGLGLRQVFVLGGGSDARICPRVWWRRCGSSSRLVNQMRKSVSYPHSIAQMRRSLPGGDVILIQ